MASQWRASWISLGTDPREDIGVFQFRCRFTLDCVADACLVRVSADQRYKFYCNGSFVDFGPQRGDEKHWFYETLDLAPFLVSGENLLEVLVWNFGRWAPMAQCSARTGFVLEAPEDFARVSTPGDWEVSRVAGWDFAMMHSGIGEFYIDVGPGEIIDAASIKFLDFRKPHVICTAEDRGSTGGGTPWMLIPRTLPPMRYELRTSRPVVRRGFVGDRTPVGLEDGQKLAESFELAAGENLLLDFGELLCAYPRLVGQTSVSAVSARTTFTYSESLWNDDGTKGNRHDVAGKVMHGYQDVFTFSDEPATLETLWWRTFRYVLIECHLETGDHSKIQSPKVSVSLDAIETGFPLVAESSFSADESSVKPIWDVALRTAERCAGETYFDCPYYEQLQYVGDSRIQALIGYYVGRDRALPRNAVETLGWSIMENGLTQSRYPSRQAQVIPPFSLWWVVMLYDQMLYDDKNWEYDKESNRALWEIQVWHWRRRWNKSPSEFWCFVDWAAEWRAGVPPGAADHPANVLLEKLIDWSITAVSSNRKIASLPEHNLELPKIATSKELITRAWGGKWPGSKEPPSEHAEALWRILQLYADQQVAPWPTEALERANAAECTFYFQYYKHLAMFGAPEEQATEHDYLAELQPWREMIEDGLTTFAENPEPTRSDCHAWSAHPILGFFQIIAGVTSIAPAWKKARIMPHPGSLRRFDARIAHPDGELRVAYEGEKFTIDSPVSFEFRWRELRHTFESGSHRIG